MLLVGDDFWGLLVERRSFQVAELGPELIVINGVNTYKRPEYMGNWGYFTYLKLVGAHLVPKIQLV